jgi:2-polyprenyl-3-methyl-5-hydroxy-6-metoxy-1,4-benzoquinol methylase
LGRFELLACPACTLHFAPTAFNVAVNYTEIYSTSEYIEEQVQFLNNRDPYRAKSYPTYKPFFSRLRASRGHSLLDVGCGVGRFCQAASVSGWQVTGIDISEEAIALGRQQADFPMLNCTLEDVTNSGKRFQIITAFEVIEHLSDPVHFLATVRAALTPDGEFFGTVPNWCSPEVQNATRPDWIPPVHLCYHTDRSLHSLAEKAGFRSVAVGYIESEPAPKHPLRFAKWSVRRILGSTKPPLGLWLHVRR